jgi:putative DNA primase/helicase
MKDDLLGVEVYATGRYLTVTGQQIPDTPSRIADAPHALCRLVAAIDAAREAKRRKSNGDGSSDTHGTRVSDFFEHVNVVALARLDGWVPRVLPKAVKHATGAWRVSSRDLGRDYEEDLSIHPTGIQDFGPETGLSPVDVVLKYGTAADAAEAALWLCETLAIDPIALGWKGTKKHVDRASDQQEEREVGRLAALGTFEYERVREAEAQRLNVRVGVLDGQVAKRRKTEEHASKPGFLKPPTPWEAPVMGTDLLANLEQALSRHVKLGSHACSATALWVVHCHAIDSAEIAAALAIESPEKRCGKTTLLSVIQALVPKSLTAANMSPAAVFRAVEEFRPTLIIDEADTFLTADKPELIGILNSSHVRTSAYVVRVVGDKHEVKVFNTWCAKAIALIGELPSTLQDRSIVIRMRRKQKHESVQRLRLDRLAPLQELCSKCARWVADHRDLLASADPAMPPQLNDRAADNWRSLLAIADAAGGGWPARGPDAAVALSGASQDEDDLSKGVTLLRDCRRVF